MKHEIVLTEETYSASALKKVIEDIAKKHSLQIEVRVA